MKLNANILKKNTGNTYVPTISKNLDVTEFSDLDIPIAHTKGTRSCILHPTSNFISYQKLSPSFRAFAINLL